MSQAPSRSPSVGPVPEPVPQQQRSSRRGRSRASRSISASESDSPRRYDNTSNINPNTGGRNRRRGKKQRGLPGIEDFDREVRGQYGTPTLTRPLPGVDEFDEVVRGGQQKEDKKDTLKLRLDLNLDVAVELKAKVHGDVTLSLL